MGDINMGYIGWDVVRLRHCSEVVMMNARTQNRRIIDWLAAGRSLTTMQAFTKWGVTRLSGRIYELRGEGHKIDAPMRAVGGKHVACYRLAR